jgi:hypothetical protein
MNMGKWCSTFFASVLLVLGCSGEGVSPADRTGSPGRTDEINAATASASFSGTVRDEQGIAQAGAKVVINGISRTTDSSGRYFMSVKASANGYNLSIQRSGFAPTSQFYAAPVRTSLAHTLQRAYTASISPSVDNTVVSPEGVRVALKANTLVTATGTPAAGTVTVTVASYHPLRMPGDFTAVNASGQQVALESVGAVFIGATDSGGQALSLKAGSTAEGFIPVPSQLGSMPSCVFDGRCRLAMWKFDPSTGKWEERPAANMQASEGGTSFTMRGPTSGVSAQSLPVTAQAIPEFDGLGIWNADTETRTPACTVINFVGIPAECYGTMGTMQINVKLPTGNGLLLPSTSTISVNAPFLVLYNARPNALQEVGITFPESESREHCAKNLEISSDPPPPSTGDFPLYLPTGGSTQFGSGGPWGGTGWPRDTEPESNALIDFQDVAFGTHPCHSSAQFTTSL